MSILLLAIIYLIFISLGLPDSLLGSSWPSISQSLNISESFQGIITIISFTFTIFSSFFTVKLIHLLKERGVIVISIFLTCLGLVLVSISPNFIALCFSVIPLGLGAGAIDSTLNNYVAVNYKAIHLNWLHAFWGVGATISPFLVSIFLTDLNGWRNGAFCLAIIQSVVFLITLISIRVWKVVELQFNQREKEVIEENNIKLGFFKTFTIKGVMFALFAFFSYMAVEGLVGYWFSSMMVFGLGVNEDIAARWTSYFYLGIMIGRILSGFISLKIEDKNMIRLGEAVVLIGTIMLFMSFEIMIMPFAVFIIGFGCAPIFPSIVHATPSRFTKELSQNVMSIQVGCAYIASLVIVPSFGAFAKLTTFKLLPYLVIIFVILMTICNEITLIKTKDKTQILKK